MSTLYSINSKIFNINGQILMMPDHRVPFTFKIDTTLGNGFPSFKIPLIEGTHDFNYSVNDGAPVYITSYNQPETLITFAQHGIYEIKVRGVVGNWSDSNTGDVQKYIECSKFGTTEFGSIRNMFYGAINLKLLSDEGPNAPKAEKADNFLRESGITSTPINVFKRAPKLTYMSSAFKACGLLTTPIPSGMLDKNSKLQYCNAMYSDCINMTGGVPVGYFANNPSIVTVEQFCFNAPKMNGTVDAYIISHLTNLTNMQYFMAQNPLLNITLAEDSWLNLTKVTTIASAYYMTPKVTGTVPSLRNMALLNNVSRAFFMNRNLTIPAVMFDLTKVYNILTWQDFAKVASSTYSHTGTLQDFWNYADPASTHTGVFMNCTALTNYNDLRLVWPT